MKKMLKDKIRRLKIFQKIYAVYLICIVPFLVLLCLAIVLVLRSILFSNIALSVDSNSSIITRRIEDKMQDAENCSNMMLAYLNELDFLKNSSVKVDDLTRYNEILKRITYTTQVFRSVDAMVFIDEQGNIYGQNPQIEQVAASRDINKLLGSSQFVGGKPYWLDISIQNSLSQQQDMLTLTMVKNITDISTGERLGILVLALDESSITNLFSQLKLTENSSYSLADKNGLVLMPREAEKNIPISLEDPAGIMKGHVMKGDYYFLAPFTKVPLFLVFHAPLSDMTRYMQNLIALVVAVGIVAAGLSLVISMKIARIITGPIVKLTQKMEMVTRGDMAVRFYSNTGDETQMLSDGFNEMLDTIENLISNIREEQKAKRKFELALLQSQIKPHFLYNTLDTIYALIYIQKYEDAIKTTKSLVEFYRLALSSGAEIITIESEIKCIGDYLSIQALRFSDEFSYSVSLPDEILPYSIPKLLIQPIVENAIYHGLRENESKGLLSITATHDDSSIFIKVSDNGVGMDEQTVSRILSYEKQGSFGLKNSNDRIRLYFGSEYGISISSSPGEGTDVIIHIPKISGG